MKVVRSTTCGSSANLGSGFDSFGIALDAIKTYVTVREAEYESNEVHETVNTQFNYDTSTLPGFLADEMCKSVNYGKKYSLDIQSNVPVGRGLGSSGAVSVGVVAAMSKFLGLNLTDEEIITTAMNGEEFACGSRHGDNVTASVKGGFTILHSTNPVITTTVKPKTELKFMIIIPEITEENKTKFNRSLIPERVSFKDSVSNTHFANAFVMGIKTGRRELLSLGMNDSIVEKARAQKYSFLYDIKSICLGHGAIGAVLSGAGPSILTLIDNQTEMSNMKTDLNSYFSSIDLKYDLIYSGVGEGVKVE